MKQKLPPTVLSIIENGYVLPLISELTLFIGKNHSSAFMHAQFVQESVMELLAAGCVEEVKESLMSVVHCLWYIVSSSGKKRLVVNLQHLYCSLWKQKFKYKDLRVAMLLLEREDFLFPLISSQATTMWM